MCHTCGVFSGHALCHVDLVFIIHLGCKQCGSGQYKPALGRSAYTSYYAGAHPESHRHQHSISVVGGVIIGIGDFATGKTALWGDVLALIGGVCVAIYLLLGRTLRSKLSLLAYVTVCYGSAAVILWMIVWLLGAPVSGFDLNTWYCLLAMATIPQLIGHTSYNWALKWFSTHMIAVSLLGEPICGTVLAYIIFNEGLNSFKIIGGIFILSAIYLAVSGEK